LMYKNLASVLIVIGDLNVCDFEPQLTLKIAESSLPSINCTLNKPRN